jgi:hypothetical protein
MYITTRPPGWDWHVNPPLAIPARCNGTEPDLERAKADSSCLGAFLRLAVAARDQALAFARPVGFMKCYPLQRLRTRGELSAKDLYPTRHPTILKVVSKLSIEWGCASGTYRIPPAGEEAWRAKLP